MKDFDFEVLISDMEKKNITKEDEFLLGIARHWFSEREMLSKFRDLYYHDGYKDYDGWFEDEINSRYFWDDLYDTVGLRDKFQDHRDALEDPRLGKAGRELFANIAVWFYENGFIRDDFTVWNARLFRYLDSYCWSKYNLVLILFNRYNTARNLEELRREVMKYLQQNLNSYEYKALEKQIDIDERCFEKHDTPPKAKKQNLISAHQKIKDSLVDGIYKIITKEKA